MADISFVVIDLKYSKDLGVKICEIQPGSFSRFSGSDVLEKVNIVQNRYCDLLQQYHFSGYFTHPLYPKMKQVLIERNFSSTHSVRELAAKIPKKIDSDPDNLFDYQACLFSLERDSIIQGDPSYFSQILFLDRAILPYSQNKYTMNTLLDKVEKTKQLRPIWRVYQKGASQTLINQIINDIPGDIVVLKPIQSTMGRGVIILEKKDLPKTLEYIFCSSNEILLKDLERSYSQYAIDTSNSFIVEEFIPSDPLFLGEESLPYDCTMRIMAVLSYHQKIPKIDFLSEYWYSPNKPIDPAYTLIQSHKAKGTYFHKVDPKTLEEVQNQLSPALLEVYQYMLTEPVLVP
ncbi:MAG: hypothetical protein JSS09_02050 [Verrucomicrobia bacterium]|nr:hypothetical protein [Verrucomicrobiota bacterium]